MVRRRLPGVALGVVLDRVAGEPAFSPHPVALFGSAMRALERRVWRNSRIAGALPVTAGVLVGWVSGMALRSVAAGTYLAVAGKALGEAALGVASCLEGGRLEEARTRLPSLVGRETSALDGKEMARAVVESVAENTVDAVVAPAAWAAVGGAPGALAYRAVNTLDSLFGHRSRRYARFGWASARLDDAAGWVPARLTAVLVAVVRPRCAGAIWRAVRQYAPSHPSPNAGVAEAAFAAALGLRLGGESRYGDRVEIRPPLGSGRPAEAADVAAAVRLSRQVAGALAVALCLPAALARLRSRGAFAGRGRGASARSRK